MTDRSDFTEHFDSGDAHVFVCNEYGPFGELIRATGPMAKANPFRFSSKYQDDENDLVYYIYRYYNPQTGRWVSRDLLADRGYLVTTRNPNRKALSKFLTSDTYINCANDEITEWDYLGLSGSSIQADGHDICPQKDNGLILNGYANLRNINGKVTCIYTGCGSALEYNYKIITGEPQTSYEWIPDSLGGSKYFGTCFTIINTPATGYTVRLSCSCATKTVTRSSNPPYSILKEEVSTQSGSPTIIRSWSDTIVTIMPNSKSYTECNPTDTSLSL